MNDEGPRPAPRRPGASSSPGRALLRTVAAGVVGGSPGGVAVRVRCPRCGRPHGKPRVDGLELSLAHSGERVVLAWRERGEVGVDVEQVRPGYHATDLGLGSDYAAAVAAHDEAPVTVLRRDVAL